MTDLNVNFWDALGRCYELKTRMDRTQRVIDAAIAETKAEEVVNYQATQKGLTQAVRAETIQKLHRAHELRADEVRDYLDWLHEDAGPIT